MRKSHDPRRDLIDAGATAEKLLDAEAHIAASRCSAVNRDLLATLKWLVWAVDFQRIAGGAADAEDVKAALVAARAAIAKAGG
jgi:hypothetical protein